MSEFARLQDKLSKLRQKERAPGEGRRLHGNDSDSRLAALVTEIDETILPRRLSFETEKGVISLAVANRRLQALLAPAPKDVSPDLVDHELPDIEDPLLSELGATLKMFLADVDMVKISASRLTQSFGSDIGVPANQLPRVWDVAEATKTTPAEVLASFLTSVDISTAAWLRIEGEEVTDQGGAEDAVAALGEHAAVFLDGYFSKFDVAFREPSDACATLISPKEQASNGLLFVEIGDVSAIVSAPVGALLPLASSWQKLTRA